MSFRACAVAVTYLLEWDGTIAGASAPIQFENVTLKAGAQRVTTLP